MSNEEKKSESAYKEGESSEPQEKKDQYGNPVFDTPEEEAEYRKKTLDMANRIIDGLSVNKANFEHIAQTGKVNGSLRQELIEKIFAKLPDSAPSESQEELRSKLQRYQQTLIARYYNNDLTEKEKIDLNKIIDELSDLLK